MFFLFYLLSLLVCYHDSLYFYNNIYRIMERGENMNFKMDENKDVHDEIIGSKDVDSNKSKNVSLSENTKFEDMLDSAVEAGDNFFIIGSMVCEVFMGLMSWIMRHAYLIAVIIVAILFVTRI